MRRQPRDLARMVHAQLDHADAVLRAQAQQRQRHADVVVEVALRRERARRRSQARRIDAIICVTVVLPLLPVTAISGSCEAARASRRPARRSARQRVGAPRSPGRPASARPRCGDRRDRAGARAPAARKSLRIEALALQRDEQVARLQRARVAVHARDRHARRRRPASPPGSQRVRLRPASSCRSCALLARAAPRCACADVGERHASRPRSPGSPRGPCRRAAPRRAAPACAMRLRDRRARGRRCTSTRSRRARPGEDLRRGWRSGFSLRGLSLVTTTRSACRSATRAHQRALGRVAVAAAAEHAPQLRRRAPRPAGAAPAAPCRARRACGRSRPPPAAGRARSTRSMRPGTGVRPRAGRHRLRQRHARARAAPPSTPSRLDDVVLADQARSRSACRSPPSCSVEAQAAVVVADVAAPAAAPSRAQRVGPHVERAAVQLRAPAPRPARRRC